MGVVTFLDLSLFQSGGGGGDPTKFAPKLVLSVDTIASLTATTQVAVSAPDGDVWTITSEVDGFTGATGTGNTFVYIGFPENTGETARDIVVTVTGQYGSNSYTITQREPLDVIATYNIDSTGSKQLMRSTSYYQYYTVDEDPTQYTGNSYNFQTTGEHVVKYRVKNLGSWSTVSVWGSQKPVALVIPDMTISNQNINHDGLLDVTYYGNEIVNTYGVNLFASTITGVTLPNVTTITGDTFNGCTALTNVNITGATSIGEQAFNGCSSLTSVAFPNVTTIGHNAFNVCSSLSAITMPNVTTIGDNVFIGCAFTSVTVPSGVTAGSNTFKNCTSLSSCVIGDNCQFGTNTFNGCTSLTSVTVGNDCTIGGRCWQGCSGLTSLTLGTGITFTGIHNFSDCVALTDLTLPEGTVFSVTGQQAYNCTALTALTINCDAPAQAFYNTKFASDAVVTIGTGCTSIGASGFTNATGVTSITFESGSTPCTIGFWCWASASTLTTIDLGNRGMFNTSANILRACPKLKTITNMPIIPEEDGTVRFRGSSLLNDYRFETINGQGGDGTLVIPEGFTTIATRSLEKVGISATTVINTIDIPSTVEEFANNAISGTQVTAIICRATTAPTITNGNTFAGLPASGTLYTPADADYTTWLAALGEGWTQETIPA